jgi:hypothetical protein
MRQRYSAERYSSVERPIRSLIQTSPKRRLTGQSQKLKQATKKSPGGEPGLIEKYLMRWNGEIEADVAEPSVQEVTQERITGWRIVRRAARPARHTSETTETASAVHPALLGPFVWGGLP